MQPWEQLDATTVPGTRTEMTLHRRGEVFSIRVGGVELMNNWIYGIDCGLADHGCGAIGGLRRETARVLIGGLGMGFTLARTLTHLGAAAEVVVAELVPAVVRWNREVFGQLAGHPLEDPRVTVFDGDVGRAIRRAPGGYDAIFLDVDNGPEGLSRQQNDTLYGRKGLDAARAALRPGGVLAIWSLSGDRGFSDRLERAGYSVSEHEVKKRGGRARQLIFVGKPGAMPAPGASEATRRSDATRSPRGKGSARDASSPRGQGAPPRGKPRRRRR